MTEGTQRLATLKETLLAGKEYRIVFLGDSITSTEWVHPNWREIVEYVLKGELEDLGPEPFSWKAASWGIRCINSGFDGATSADLLDRLESDVFSYHPALVIACIGKNDMHLGRTPEEHRADVATLIEQLATHVPHSIFMTSVATPNEDANAKYNVYREMILGLFPREDVQFIDLYERFQQLDLEKMFTFKAPVDYDILHIKKGEIDYLHPSHLGNAYLAKIVLEEGFGLTFNPELFLKNNNAGDMYPDYR